MPYEVVRGPRVVDGGAGCSCNIGYVLSFCRIHRLAVLPSDRKGGGTGHIPGFSLSEEGAARLMRQRLQGEREVDKKDDSGLPVIIRAHFLLGGVLSHASTLNPARSRLVFIPLPPSPSTTITMIYALILLFATGISLCSAAVIAPKPIGKPVTPHGTTPFPNCKSRGYSFFARNG